MNLKQLVIDRCISGEVKEFCSLASADNIFNVHSVGLLLDTTFWVLLHVSVVYLAYQVTGKLKTKPLRHVPSYSLNFIALTLFFVNVTVPICLLIVSIYIPSIWDAYLTFVYHLFRGGA